MHNFTSFATMERLTVYLAICCCVYLGTSVLGQDVEDGPIVSTTYGDLRGVSLMDSKNRTYDGFFGIPFADPPLGDLRFKAAQTPPESWEGVRNATEFGPHCIQALGGVYRFLGLSSNDSEDCLYLNVYVPQNVDYAVSQSLPVMFFFYGGAYLIGTAEMYPGQELATAGNVVVVTTNYRISFLGFMSTDDDAAPGNYALWDGKAALEWTQDNIAAFGGDPGSVTVFGHSAGAGMTMHSTHSPQTNTLFQRAIGVSGSATGITTTVDNPKRQAQHLADLFFCNTTDSAEIVACLREKDAKDLDTLGLISINNDGRIPNLLPVVDGEFIVQDPRQSVEDGVNAHLDFMTGYTVHDGAAFALANPLGSPPLFNITRSGNLNNEEIYDYFIKAFGGYDDPEGLYQVMFDRYPLINSTDDKECSRAAVEATTYWFFSSAAHYEAEQHALYVKDKDNPTIILSWFSHQVYTAYRIVAAGAGSTYVYQFEYLQSFLTGYPDWVNGSHMDDIYSVFGDPFMKVFRIMFLDTDEFTEQDHVLESHVQSRFVNFAYTGNPNEGPFAQDTQWPEYDSSRQYLIQSLAERTVSMNADTLEEINWFLYEFWPLLKPQWGVGAELGEVELDPEDLENRIPVDEYELLEKVAMTRLALYDQVNWEPDLMDIIDERIDSALLSREMYRDAS